MSSDEKTRKKNGIASKKGHRFFAPHVLFVLALGLYMVLSETSVAFITNGLSELVGDPFRRRKGRGTCLATS